MKNGRDIRAYCDKAVRPLWDEFEPRRRVLTAIARNLYPAAVPGLQDSPEAMSRDQPSLTSRLYTSVPVESLRRGAAGLQINITSPARQWFRFRIKTVDEDTDNPQLHDAMEYLDALRRSTEEVFHRSGLYNQTATLYHHLLAFNFACMLVLEDAEKIVRPITLRPGTYALGVGADGRVETVARKFAYTRAQLIEEFGEESLPDEVKRANPAGDKRWVVHNLIEPNNDNRGEITHACGVNKEMAYRSIYWLEAAGRDGGIIRTAGYFYNPIVAPRFSCETGETYGTGRGEIALPLARGLQALRKDQLEISGNRAEPAVLASSDLEARGLDMGRGAVNYVRFGQQGGEMVYPVFKQPPDSSESRADFDVLRQEINQIFFTDAFASIDNLKYQNRDKTAFEVEQIVRENMEALGPVVTALDRDMLDPLVTLVALYTIKANRVPVAPPDGIPLGDILNASAIEYLSTIHLAQRSQELRATQTWLQLVGSQSQFAPEVLDNVDTDAVTIAFARLLGVPEKTMRGKEQVEAIRTARAEQQAAAAQQQQAAMDLQAVKTIGELPIDAAHGGGAMVDAMQGGAA